jgi:hypothetical protein
VTHHSKERGYATKIFMEPKVKMEGTIVSWYVSNEPWEAAYVLFCIHYGNNDYDKKFFNVRVWYGENTSVDAIIGTFCHTKIDLTKKVWVMLPEKPGDWRKVQDIQVQHFHLK